MAMRVIDPVGFTFENYDGLGLWRDTENGQPIDATGGVQISRDTAVVGPVTGVAELSQKLAGSRNVHDCVAKEFYRFALGRALMARPSLMLLDEPSLGLSPKLVREMFRLILEINRAGVTILLVEQNARQALRISNRAYVLEKGLVSMTGAANWAEPR